MIVVSDTGPINYLVLIGAADVLPRLYGRVLIPGAVYDELIRAETPAQVRQWLQEPPDWLERHAVEDVDDFARLDPGEREVITLSLALGADLALLDERKGRAVAQEQGLKVVGTLGILAQAAAQNLLALPDAIERLRQTSFQISEALLEAVLEYDRRRQARPSPTPDEA